MSGKKELPPPLQRVLVKLKGVEERGGLQFAARCPAHDDREPSLSVSWGDKNAVVLHCHAGCDADDVLSEIGLTWKSLSAKPSQTAVYRYTDEDDNLLYEVVRYGNGEGKTFKQRRPDPDKPGQYIWNVKGLTPVPYRLVELAEELSCGTDIWIVEGEKDVEAMVQAYGYPMTATCNHGGADMWKDEHSEHFQGSTSRVTIVADRDVAGHRHARKVRESLQRVAGIEARVVLSAEGKDAADHCGDHGLDEFIELSLEALDELCESAGDASAKGAGRAPGLEDGPLSEYVADKLQGHYAYVSERKNWLHNAGPVWEPSSQTAVIEAVRDELKNVFDAELSRGTNVGQISQLLRRGKMENVAALLKGILEVSYSEFDTHPDHLNTPGGIVNLRTGVLEPHSDAFKFTRITKASYNPAATSRRWSKALNALPKELHEHIQILFGQAVTGHPPDHDRVTFLQGGGANGKSSLLDGIQLALGSFAGPVPEKVMVGRAGDGTPTEMMELRGKRLVVLEEMPQGAPLGTKRLKDVAGTATINARPLYGEVVTWQATHTMFVTSNHRPHVTETDHGTWRRLQMVAFPYRFVSGGDALKPGERRGDPSLRHHFRTVPDEAVLAWLVAGARRWYELGMRTPEAPAAIAAATDAWRHLTDDVMQFVEERFVFDPEGVVLAGDVWRSFDGWAKSHNKHGWSQNTYADRFEEHPLLKAHGVHHTRKRVDSLTVSLPPFLVGPGPTLREPNREAQVTGKQRVWLGMRWRENP